MVILRSRDTAVHVVQWRNDVEGCWEIAEFDEAFGATPSAQQAAELVAQCRTERPDLVWRVVKYVVSGYSEEQATPDYTQETPGKFRFLFRDGAMQIEDP